MGWSWEGEHTGPVRTLADLEVHVPIKSSCVVADVVLLSNAAVLKSNVLRPTIVNDCPSSPVRKVAFKLYTFQAAN